MSKLDDIIQKLPSTDKESIKVISILNYFKRNISSCAFWTYADQFEGFYYKTWLVTPDGILKIDTGGPISQSEKGFKEYAARNPLRILSEKELIEDWSPNKDLRGAIVSHINESKV
jgi:hypothetical protein